MTDPYGSPDAAGSQPTQPFWVDPGPQASGAGLYPPPHSMGGAQPGAAGLWPAAGQAPSFGDHLQRDRRKALNWTLGLVAAALLAGGGVIAGLSLAGHASPAAGQSQAPAAAQQAALLNTALSNANSPGALSAALGATTLSGASAPDGSAATLCAKARSVARAAGRKGLPRLSHRIARGAARCRLARRRVFMFFLLRGVDGQFTIQTKQGTKTLAYARGVIQSVDPGKSVVVQATDGTTWTWDIVSTTVVRDQQGKAPQSDLVTGTPVWVGGPVVQNAKDARLIVLRPPQPAAASPSPAPGS